MTRRAASVFGGSEEDLPTADLAGFHPKEKRSENPHSDTSIIEAAAKESNFVSREPKLDRRVTGRNIQLNIKASQQARDLLYEIAEEFGWAKNLAFEKAVVALKRTLDEGEDPRNLSLD